MREKVVKKNGDEGESKKRDTEAVGREGGKNGEHSREKGCSRKVKEKRKRKKCKR